jgi:hypothetical protein
MGIRVDRRVGGEAEGGGDGECGGWTVEVG